jgi:type VI secretion system secreted protein Hcp
MAVDIFLKIEGIKGESKDAAHKDEIDVLSWSWGMSQSGGFHAGGGGGSGKVQVRDLSFVKPVDKASPALGQHLTNGKHIKSARLTVRKAGDKPLEYLTVDLEDLIVSSVNYSRAGGPDDFVESVTLNFARFKSTYRPQQQDGSAGPAVEMGWNIPGNAPF